MSTKLDDDDYILTEGGAWFDVGGFTVRIHADAEGIRVTVLDPASVAENALCAPLNEGYVSVNALSPPN